MSANKIPVLVMASVVAPAILWQAKAAEAPSTAQITFATPAEATNALAKAVETHNRDSLREIFGPEGTNLLTGDRALDERHFRAFQTNLATHCALVPEGNDRMSLEIGERKWIFPIPLVQTNGSWMFDTAAGAEEIINRHIGRDEFYAIGVCRAYVKAQQEFAQKVRGARRTS